MTIAVLSESARQDLLNAMEWIARDNPRAALSLRNSVQEVVAKIGDYPELGVSRPEIIGDPYRFFSLSGFPYILVYDRFRTPPVVIRVLHTSRDLSELLSVH